MSQKNITYLFYDLETTGLNKCFDQVVQFAAIRTDTQLNELERHEIHIKRMPDIIPAPQAIITHRIGIKQMQTGESEIKGIQKIHRLLNTPGTISVGYNSLGFDDEFLRFSFYRNLLTPYTHQYANQCSRMDIYPMTAVYYLFNRELLNWPVLNEKVSLKLESINQSNQLATGQAHNAMVDVEVTLELARRLLKSPKMWHYLTDAFNKKIDMDRMSDLPFTLKVGDFQYQEGIMVSGSFGSEAGFHAPVVGLGQHLHYKNQTLWLRLDQENLSNCDAEKAFVIRKKSAEKQILLPPSKRFQAHLSEQRRKITDENRRWLQENPQSLQKLCEYHQHFKYPVMPNIDSQAALYEAGFPSPQEEKLFAQFHKAKAAEKSTIIEKIYDKHRRELAYRLMARHFPEQANAEAQSSYAQYQKQLNSTQPPVDFRGEAQRNQQQCLETAKQLLQNPELDAEQIQLLEEFKHFMSYTATS